MDPSVLVVVAPIFLIVVIVIIIILATATDTSGSESDEDVPEEIEEVAEVKTSIDLEEENGEETPEVEAVSVEEETSEVEEPVISFEEETPEEIITDEVVEEEAPVSLAVENTKTKKVINKKKAMAARQERDAIKNKKAKKKPSVNISDKSVSDLSRKDYMSALDGFNAYTTYNDKLISINDKKKNECTSKKTKTKCEKKINEHFDRFMKDYFDDHDIEIKNVKKISDQREDLHNCFVTCGTEPCEYKAKDKCITNAPEKYKCYAKCVQK